MSAVSGAGSGNNYSNAILRHLTARGVKVDEAKNKKIEEAAKDDKLTSQERKELGLTSGNGLFEAYARGGKLASEMETGEAIAGADDLSPEEMEKMEKDVESFASVFGYSKQKAWELYFTGNLGRIDLKEAEKTSEEYKSEYNAYTPPARGEKSYRSFLVQNKKVAETSVMLEYLPANADGIIGTRHVLRFAYEKGITDFSKGSIDSKLTEYNPGTAEQPASKPAPSPPPAPAPTAPPPPAATARPSAPPRTVPNPKPVPPPTVPEANPAEQIRAATQRMRSIGEAVGGYATRGYTATTRFLNELGVSKNGATEPAPRPAPAVPATVSQKADDRRFTSLEGPEQHQQVRISSRYYSQREYGEKPWQYDNPKPKAVSIPAVSVPPPVPSVAPHPAAPPPADPIAPLSPGTLRDIDPTTEQDQPPLRAEPERADGVADLMEELFTAQPTEQSRTQAEARRTMERELKEAREAMERKDYTSAIALYEKYKDRAELSGIREKLQEALAAKKAQDEDAAEQTRGLEAAKKATGGRVVRFDEADESDSVPAGTIAPAPVTTADEKRRAALARMVTGMGALGQLRRGSAGATELLKAGARQADFSGTDSLTVGSRGGGLTGKGEVSPGRTAAIGDLGGRVAGPQEVSTPDRKGEDPAAPQFRGRQEELRLELVVADVDQRAANLLNREVARAFNRVRSVEKGDCRGKHLYRGVYIPKEGVVEFTYVGTMDLSAQGNPYSMVNNNLPKTVRVNGFQKEQGRAKMRVTDVPVKI